MLIKNGVVLTETGNFETKNVYTKDVFITKEESDGETIDAKGCYILPGLIYIFMDVMDMTFVMEQ